MKSAAIRPSRVRWLLERWWIIWSATWILGGAGYVASDRPAIRRCVLEAAAAAKSRGVAVIEGLVSFAGRIPSVLSAPRPGPDPLDRCLPLLAEADRDAGLALDRQLRKVDEVMAEAKRGSRDFADDVLSYEGQAYFVVGGGIQNAVWAWNQVASAFDLGTVEPPRDHFRSYVRERFELHTLKAARLRQAVAAAANGYANELAGIESRLMIKLRADLPDAPFPQPTAALRAVADAPVDGLIDAAVATVGGDILASAVEDYAEEIIGGLMVGLADGILSWATGGERGLTGSEKFAIDALTQAVTSQALSGLERGAGYDPEASLASGVGDALDAIRRVVVDGDADAARDYKTLLMCGLGHPDPAVRAAASDAASAMEGDARLGLRPKLMGMQMHRSAARYALACRMARGGDVPLPLPFAGSPQVSVPGPEMLSFARGRSSSYRKGKP